MVQIKQGYSAEDTLDDLNALMYIIKGQIENSVNTIELVRVLKVNDDNTIDVIPAIKNINASREPIDESPIHNVRYVRFQYGLNAITVKPKEDDVGLLLVCKRDISAYDSGMVATRVKYNLTNGIYLGGLCGANQDPTQFIHFEDDTIDITGTGTININAPTVNVKSSTANVEATGTATVKGATVNVEASGTATIKGDTVNVEVATALNLGGEEGAKGIARIGDTVAGGKITGGSSKVKAV